MVQWQAFDCLISAFQILINIVLNNKYYGNSHWSTSIEVWIKISHKTLMQSIYC